MSNSPAALDLYAKVEDLLGVKEAAPRLYVHYLLALGEINFVSLLDVGCGSGDFIAQLQGAFPEARFEGIDRSPEMVRRARERGVDARCIDLCDVTGRYDVITCVFDMLNYLEAQELGHFLSCLRERLNPGGELLCDLTTRYGFESVAVGAFVGGDEARFVAIDGEFEADTYRSRFTLFERERGGCWRRSEGEILQFLHDPETIARLGGLEWVAQEPIHLYVDEEADKIFLRYRKPSQ